MILFRFLSILAGALVLVVPPLFLFSGAPAPELFDGRTVPLMIAGLPLVASSFFFIGLARRPREKSAPLRMLDAAPLAVPFTASVAMLWRADQPGPLWLAGLLLCFSLVLLMMILFPAEDQGQLRSSRAREERLGRMARG